MTEKIYFVWERIGDRIEFVQAFKDMNRADAEALRLNETAALIKDAQSPNWRLCFDARRYYVSEQTLK